MIQDMKNFFSNKEKNPIIVNAILLSVLITADMVRIFDNDLSISLAFIYLVYLSPTFMNIMILITLIIYIINFIIERRYGYTIVNKKSLIVMGFSYIVPPILFIILPFFSDNSIEIFYTALYGCLAYIFGLITSFLYYIFLNWFYPYIIGSKRTLKCKLFIIFITAISFIIAISIINNLGPIDNLKEIPLFTITYGLLGSFLGSELCTLYESKKQYTNK